MWSPGIQSVVMALIVGAFAALHEYQSRRQFEQHRKHYERIIELLLKIDKQQ